MKHTKLFRNRNFRIIAIVVVCIAAILIVSLVLRPAPSVASDAQRIALPSATEAAPEESAPATDEKQATDTDEEPVAYVLCTLPATGQYGIIPLPKEGEVSYPVPQSFSDGTHCENILHLTPEGFCMEYSTCKNQDCVGQGTVTLENREERVLQNCVICLPNQFMAELYTAEEIAEMNLSPMEDAQNLPSED